MNLTRLTACMAKRAPDTRQGSFAGGWVPLAAKLPHSDWRPPEAFPRLKGRKRVTVDTETKDPTLKELGPGFRRGAYIVGISVGFGWDEGAPERYYFPMRHEGGGNMDPDQVLRWARDEMNSFDGELCGAELLYDLDGLANEGITFPHVKSFEDVQAVAEPLLDEWRYQYNLDALAKDYLGEGKDELLLTKVAASYGYKKRDDIKGNIWRFPAQFVGPYAEADVDRPERILPIQLRRLEEEGLLHIYDIERRLIPILLAMRRRGVPVDLERAKVVRERLVKERTAMLTKLKHLAGSRAEFMQPDSFAPALTERGLVFPLTAKTKMPSITKTWLEANEGDELVDTIQRGRKVNTVINTFIDGHVLTHSINGRVHCVFSQLKGDDGGTIARFSSSDPNLQNITARDDELAPLVRGIFVPEQGEDWQRDDYSQIEYRLLVHFARGRGAVEARALYNSDPETDYHKFVAEMLGVDPEDKIMRKRVKNTNFAKGYGAQAPKLAKTFGCSLEEAKEFIQKYEEALPFTVTTFEAAEKWARRRGYVQSILGRRQRFLLWVPQGKEGRNALPRRYEEAVEQYGPRLERYKTYAALNRKNQSSCADIMKKAMVDGWNAGLCAPDALGPYLVTVHDELDNSVPRTARGDEAGKELTKIMENVVKLSVPVLVDSQRGADWGACK